MGIGPANDATRQPRRDKVHGHLGNDAVTDIFISYAREDRPFAAKVAKALTERGFKVWWDWELIGGDNYRLRIREVIGEAKKSIVLWSRHSVVSAFVIDEATEAKKHAKLIPVSIDGSAPPFGFGDLHTITLEEPKLDIDMLVAALEGRAPPREQDLRKPPSRGLNKTMLAAAAACLLLIAGGGTYWTLNRPAPIAAPQPKVAEALAPVPPRAFTPRVALVIGNAAYTQLPVLANPVRDADKVAVELERRGFSVIKEINLTGEAMTRVLKEFVGTLSVVGGVGVFYYAGSAVYIDGDDIMLPVDASADMKNRRIENGVNFTQLQKEIQSRTTARLRDNGHAMIYSASKDQFASDGPAGSNSPFTQAFANALGNADDELGDTFRRIRSALAAEQQANPGLVKQTPYFENTLEEKFYFGRPDQDAKSGISKILIFDSCRDNPFKMEVVTR